MTAYTASLTWKSDTPLGDQSSATTAQSETGCVELSSAVLEELRQALLERRASLSEQIAALETPAVREEPQPADPSDGDDGRRVAWAGTVSRIAVNCKLSVLREIDQALRRMDDGTYGYDTMTGAAIPIERLRETPWARSA